ncbi:hypothetical protein GBAR_LOCUS2749 [Geodia barretti]|nr:hypothetical protein GBAR_LOCUS2749 [Geodia barretti]
MEGEISELTDERQLSPETENTLLLSLAGLKHVRDILLNKIAFSGAMLKDEHNVIVQRPQEDLNRAHPLEQCARTSSQVSQEALTVTGSNGDAMSPREPDTPPASVPHPLMSSGEMDQSTGGEGDEEADWVNVSVHAHPLVNSDS